MDKAGQTVDFLLTAHRNRAAAKRFLHKSIGSHGLPEKITIDKSGVNTAASESYNAEQKTTINIRQSKYLNNIIEQDHRAVKRIVCPRLGFKSFWAAQSTLARVEVMPLLRKDQFQSDDGKVQTPAEQFYSLAAYLTSREGSARLHSKFAADPKFLQVPSGRLESILAYFR